ncbi:hypothetical protein COX69_00495, partial [Candidatus Falkowbacteria bacterium CG_4_10_14_0_2_um_filter_48_10]
PISLSNFLCNKCYNFLIAAFGHLINYYFFFFIINCTFFKYISKISPSEVLGLSIAPFIKKGD